MQLRRKNEQNVVLRWMTGNRANIQDILRIAHEPERRVTGGTVRMIVGIQETTDTVTTPVEMARSIVEITMAVIMMIGEMAATGMTGTGTIVIRMAAHTRTIATRMIGTRMIGTETIGTGMIAIGMTGTGMTATGTTATGTTATGTTATGMTATETGIGMNATGMAGTRMAVTGTIGTTMTTARGVTGMTVLGMTVVETTSTTKMNTGSADEIVIAMPLGDQSVGRKVGKATIAGAMVDVREIIVRQNAIMKIGQKASQCHPPISRTLARVRIYTTGVANGIENLNPLAMIVLKPPRRQSSSQVSKAQIKCFL